MGVKDGGESCLDGRMGNGWMSRHLMGELLGGWGLGPTPQGNGASANAISEGDVLLGMGLVSARQITLKDVLVDFLPKCGYHQGIGLPWEPTT